MYATVVGAGVVGLSVASRLAGLLKGKGGVLLLEKHKQFGMETSSHNSEVIHASIYYKKGSLKAQLCARGNELMYDLCKKHDIKHVNCGKLIVATNQDQAAQLPALLKQATNCGAKHIRIISREEAKQMEPHVECVSALYCPTSGVVDSHGLMEFFEGVATDNEAMVLYDRHVSHVEKLQGSGGYRLHLEDGSGGRDTVDTKFLINCAGHGAPVLSQKLGIDIDKAGYRYHPTKALYYRVNKKKSLYPKMLVYPMPLPGVVGIHTCPDLAGGMRLGPWDQWMDTYDPEKLDYEVTPGLEAFFADQVRPFLPFIEPEDITPDSSGIHPKYQDKDQDIQDFIIRHEHDRGLPNFINLIGIESPGVTSAPAIGEYVEAMMRKLL